MIWLAVKGFLSRIPPVVWVGLVFAASLWAYGSLQYSNGRDDEARAWQDKIAEIRAERNAAMQIATDTDFDTTKEGEAAIEAAEQVLRGMTDDLPDKGLSPRQRARACVELRRAGRRCEFSSTSAESD